jgi:hypothetical protein
MAAFAADLVRRTWGHGMKVGVWLAISLALSMATLTDGADTYLGARWDADAVIVTMRDHRQLVVAKDAEQVGLEQAAVSSDQSAVGWLATYPNCCTSYPVPLKLMVFSGGQLRVFAPNELPVWYWAFRNGSREVCYQQETVHGGLGVRYELRDVTTGKLLAHFEPEQGIPKPGWVQELDASRH